MDAAGPPEWQTRHRQPLASYLARVVVGQQLSTRAAQTIWQRLEALAQARALALPSLVLEAPEADLRDCGLSVGKQRALRALAEADAAGALEARQLRKLDPTERARRLCQLRGIGPWTADVTGLFYFRDPDVWPIGDLTVRKTFERYLATQTRYDLDSGAALFTPNRSVLALYLWRLADAQPNR